MRQRASGRPPGGGDRQSPRLPEGAGHGPRIGGIVYTESARKVAYFVETAERPGTPLIYLQDVSGFMVGPEAEKRGHHPRGRGDGRDHGVRDGAQDRADD